MHLSTQRKHIYDPVKHPNILSDIRCFLLNFLPLSFFISNGNFEEVFRSCAFNFEKIEFSLRLSMIILKKKTGFTPCKAGQPLQGMELQEKDAWKD